MRLKSEWSFTPETILEKGESVPSSPRSPGVTDIDGPIQHPSQPCRSLTEPKRKAQADRTDSREAHLGSEFDDVEERLHQIDGDVRQLSAGSVLDKVRQTDRIHVTKANCKPIKKT